MANQPIYDLLIEQQTQDGKGRSFSASLISIVCSNKLAKTTPGNHTYRPIYMAIAGSEYELKPFVANLRIGNKALVRGGYNKKEKIEILRALEYQFSWQKLSDCSVVSIFIPEIFKLDPGVMDEDGISFCILPPNSMIKEPNPKVIEYLTDYISNNKRTKLPIEYVVNFIANMAPLFVAYLDRRSKCPMILDELFYARLLLKCIEDGLVNTCYDKTFSLRNAHHYMEYGIDHVNLHDGLIFNSTHEQLESILSGLVKEMSNG